jgi:DNA repair exonuclease SbcCD nuclease subunit
MKFIHIADVHLGAVPDADKPWGVEREKEIWNSFQNIITICNEEKIELLLIAGDLFHKQPLMRELKEVNYQFSKLETAQVVLIAGNHDPISARSYYTGFEWNDKVHMLGSESMECIYLPGLDTEVYGFSYHTRDITEPKYDTAKPEQNDRIHILLAHGGDEKNIPINKKRVEEAGFDYVALGHIHKPEIFGGKMAYSGSLEPLDKNETGERGYILGEITPSDQNRKEKFNTNINFKPSSHRQYKKLVLPISQETTNGALMDQAKDAIKRNGEKNIYRLQLAGVRDADITFLTEELYKAGNVIEVTDESVPDYDFDTLFKENADNMIGLFIQKIREHEVQDEISQKALYYGMEALLGAKDR